MTRPALIRLGIAAAGGAVIALAGVLSGIAWRAELATADLRQRWLQAKLPSRARVVLIAIDDDSLRLASEDLHRFPWPRWAYARILQVAALGTPAAIGVDLLLPEPGPGDDELVQQLASIKPLLACDVGPGGGAGALTIDGVPPANARRWGVRLAPVASFAAAAEYASVHAEAEGDGVTRRIPLVVNTSGASTAAMPLALAARAGARVESDARGVRVNGRHVTGDDGDLWLRFGGGFGHFRYIPAWVVLRAWQNLAEGADAATAAPFLKDLNGAAVLLIVTATSEFELRSSPTAAIYPGGELHATALADLLDGRFTRPPARATTALASLVAALVLGILALGVRRPAALAVAGVGALAGWCGLALLLWARSDVWLPVVAPAAAVAVVLPSLFVEGWWREGRERRRVQGIFGRYVAPDILRVLLDHPDAARLGGERRRITVLFSDIRGYTTLSENLAPEEVVSWLNEYFAAQVAVIHAHRGSVDKFIGDAVMAFWGAPLDEPRQESLAAVCAAEMVRTARRMAADWRRRGGPPLAIGVGIATGDAVVGNVGSEQLRNYTAIGDTVNLASRLEGKTKDLAVPVVLDEATAGACGQSVRSVGEVTVKGRAAAVKVFTLTQLESA